MFDTGSRNKNVSRMPLEGSPLRNPAGSRGSNRFPVPGTNGNQLVPRFPTLVGEPGTVPRSGTEVRSRRTPAGHWPINELYPWATVAGCSLHCARCGQEAQAPLPEGSAGYSEAVEAFLRAHRRCTEASMTRPEALAPSPALPRARP